VGRMCRPDIGAVDVGTGTPQAFTPMPNPFPAPATATLQCVSKASSYMRVVIPSQLVETTFGRIWGSTRWRRTREAIARIESIPIADGIIRLGCQAIPAAARLPQHQSEWYRRTTLSRT
jgi:hypothetical protein